MASHYYVHFTVETTVRVTASSEGEALKLASCRDELADDNFNVLTKKIERVSPDGPANEEAYGRAVDHVNAMEKAHGYDSDQARDARALLDEAVDLLDDDA